jgi:mevalonate kinase
MLFGEYLVLKGAKCLAFPVRYGQTLEVSPTNNPNLLWESFDLTGLWFSVEMNKQLEIISTTDQQAAVYMLQIFRHIKEQQPDLDLIRNYKITADFDLQWGFGSSSTLISSISQWADIDPYKLLSKTFGGSAYDIACATANGPIIYTIDHSVEEVGIPQKISDQLLFVYLGSKQNSRNEITNFKQAEVTPTHIASMNKMVDTAVNSNDIVEFESVIQQSEEMLSNILRRKTLKETNFADYQYSIKSLGAWGGDFFLASYRNKEEAVEYFKSKGFKTIFTYSELIK